LSSKEVFIADNLSCCLICKKWDVTDPGDYGGWVGRRTAVEQYHKSTGDTDTGAEICLGWHEGCCAWL